MPATHEPYTGQEIIGPFDPLCLATARHFFADVKGGDGRRGSCAGLRDPKRVRDAYERRGARRMSDCPRIGKLFGGCKFEPRYDEQPSGLTFSKPQGYDAAEARELFIINKYVHDICIRCGKIVKREAA